MRITGKSSFSIRSLLVFVAGLVTLACSDGLPTESSRRSQITFNFLTPATVASLRVEISGPGITPPVVVNIPVGPDTVATGTLALPAGSARQISVVAFDTAGVLTHSADTTLTLQGGVTTSLVLVLKPVAGTLGLTVTFGGDRITLTDSSSISLAVGDITVIAAQAFDATGVAVPSDSLHWGSSNPAFFTVAQGEVRAVRAGSGVVTASYRGAAASVSISVGPAAGAPSAFTWATSTAIAPPAGFFGLDGSGASDVWGPCGYRCLFRFDGASWTQLTVSFGLNLYAAHSRTLDDVYFATQTGVYRYSSGTLTQIYSGGGEYFGVWFYSELSGFVCGDGTMLHFVSGQATASISTGLQTSFNNSDRFHMTWASGPTNAYCAGRSGVYHYDGSSVTRVVSGEMRGIEGRNANDVWAVGANGALYRFDGSSWSFVDAGQGSMYLTSVRVVAPGRVVVVGTNALFELAGGNWYSYAAPAGFTLEIGALFAASSDDLFVSGIRDSDGYRVVLRATR